MTIVEWKSEFIQEIVFSFVKFLKKNIINISFANRFTKKRYVEIKENIRRRAAAGKHMKRLKNKKKWACCLLRK